MKNGMIVIINGAELPPVSRPNARKNKRRSAFRQALARIFRLERARRVQA